MTDADAAEGRRAPLWARLAGLAAVLVVAAGLVLVVVRHDRDVQTGANRPASPPRTYTLPADNGGTITPDTRPPAPGGPAPETLPRTPPTNTEVSLELERALKRRSGFTHKASCTPEGQLSKGEVLECHASSEPLIREAPPTDILVVVIDDDGRFVWMQGNGEPYSLAALQADPNLTCEALAGKGWRWGVVLAYWEANGRPAALDPDGTGRPCAASFPAGEIDAVLGAAVAA